MAATREAAGLTVRELARRVGTPASTLGDYFSGRHVPSSAAQPLVRTILIECGVEDPAQIDAWLDALLRVRSASDRRITRGAAPYRGLASFEADDADLFFGRDAVTRTVLTRIADLGRDPGPSNGVLTVIGPSGSGKSSVLRAGVLPAIGNGELDGDGTWTVDLTTPNSIVQPVTPPAGQGRHALVIDQFEEVFTTFEPTAREAYLRRLADRPAGQVLVIGMRADFYAEAAREPLLLAALQHAQIVIGPMTGAELREAIAYPAQQSGYAVEEGLIELVLADVAPHARRDLGAHDTGSLPLMSHALLATWERSSGRRMTSADYRAVGGIDAAVQRSADEVFDALSIDEQAVARSVFLRLVAIDGDVVTTRRRIMAAELDQLGTGRSEVPAIVARFVERRLITAGEGWYEISHEALLSAWPRLHAWVDEDRAGLRTHRLFTEAANRWASAEQDPSLLMRGTRLELTEAWTQRHPNDVNELEQRYLAAAVGLRDGERELARRRSRRRGQLLVTVAVLGVIAIVLSVLSYRAQVTADHARVREQAERDDALSRSAAFQALQLNANDQALAQQLALAGLNAARSSAARGAVMDESARPIMTRVLGVAGPTALATSPNSALVGVGHADDGSVHLYDTRGAHRPPGELGVVPGTDHQQVFALAFNRDATMLVTGGEDSRLRVWDVRSPARPTLLAAVPTRFTGDVQTLALSPDGDELLAGSVGPYPIEAWNISDPSHPRSIAPPSGVATDRTVQSLAVSADGRAVAAGTSDGRVHLWTRSPATGATAGTARVLHVGRNTVDAVLFDPHRPLLYTADRLGVLDVWSTVGSAARPEHVLHGSTNSQINVLALSPDGASLAAGSSDDIVRQWNTDDWTVASDVGNPGPVTGVAYLRDGDIASTAADGTLRLEAARGRRIPVSGSAFAIGYGAHGTRLFVATNGDDGGEQLWDVHDPGDPRRLGPKLLMPHGTDAIAGSGAITPDGDLVAGGNAQGMVELWDTTDPTHPHVTTAPVRMSGALVETLAFSPDGKVLAVGGDDGKVALWDVADPAHPVRLAALSGHGAVLNADFSPDGRLLALASTDDSAYLYRVADPAGPTQLARLSGFRSYVYGVGFSPDSRTVAVTSSDHTARLFDVSRPASPRRLGPPLVGSTDYVYDAAFSPDGKTVALASNDRSVRLYAADGSDALPRATLRASGSNVFTVAYSPDGRTLVAGGRAGGITSWSARPDAYRRAVCRLQGDAITRSEWALYMADQPYRPPCG